MQIKLHGGPRTEVKDLRITFPTWLPKGPNNITSGRVFGIPQLTEDHMIMITEPDMVLTFECPAEMYAFADWIYTIRAQYSDLKRRNEIGMIKEEMYGSDGDKNESASSRFFAQTPDDSSDSDES